MGMWRPLPRRRHGTAALRSGGEALDWEGVTRSLLRDPNLVPLLVPLMGAYAQGATYPSGRRDDLCAECPCPTCPAHGYRKGTWKAVRTPIVVDRSLVLIGEEAEIVGDRSGSVIEVNASQGDRSGVPDLRHGEEQHRGPCWYQGDQWDRCPHLEQHLTAASSVC